MEKCVMFGAACMSNHTLAALLIEISLIQPWAMDSNTALFYTAFQPVSETHPQRILAKTYIQTYLPKGFNTHPRKTLSHLNLYRPNQTPCPN